MNITDVTDTVGWIVASKAADGAGAVLQVQMNALDVCDHGSLLGKDLLTSIRVQARKALFMIQVDMVILKILEEEVLATADPNDAFLKGVGTDDVSLAVEGAGGGVGTIFIGALEQVQRFPAGILNVTTWQESQLPGPDWDTIDIGDEERIESNHFLVSNLVSNLIVFDGKRLAITVKHGLLRLLAQVVGGLVPFLKVLDQVLALDRSAVPPFGDLWNEASFAIHLSRVSSSFYLCLGLGAQRVDQLRSKS